MRNYQLSSKNIDNNPSFKSPSFPATVPNKSKVPMLNLNSGVKAVNSQENNLPQKNINISEINNESIEKNELSESGSINRTVLVKQIDYNPDEKSKYSIKMPDKSKSPNNISLAKKSPNFEEINQASKNDMISPNFQKKIAGKVFMPKINIKGDNRMETSKIGETPFDLKSMIINAEKRKRNDRSNIINYFIKLFQKDLTQHN